MADDIHYKKKKDKSKEEQEADEEYNRILRTEIYPLLGKSTTFSDQLDKIGFQLFGDKYLGTFPSDQIPKMSNKDNCILNLSDTKSEGTHWIGVYKQGDDVYVYDSFGRDSEFIIPSIFKSHNGRVIDSDHDAEQGLKQNSCGARSMAWLKMVHDYGIDYSLLI
jgi:hypothetical protein